MKKKKERGFLPPVSGVLPNEEGTNTLHLRRLRRQQFQILTIPSKVIAVSSVEVFLLQLRDQTSCGIYAYSITDCWSTGKLSSNPSPDFSTVRAATLISNGGCRRTTTPIRPFISSIFHPRRWPITSPVEVITCTIKNKPQK